MLEALKELQVWLAVKEQMREGAGEEAKVQDGVGYQ